jgi:hypothetical protein
MTKLETGAKVLRKISMERNSLNEETQKKLAKDPAPAGAGD